MKLMKIMKLMMLLFFNVFMLLSKWIIFQFQVYFLQCFKNPDLLLIDLILHFLEQ